MKGVLLGLALVFVASAAQAQVPSSKVETGDFYRLSIQFGTLAADTTVRFPTRQSLSNNLIDQQAANQGLRRSVNWVHLTMLLGATDQDIIIWSPTFPAGADTVRLTSLARAFSFGGCKVDSLRVKIGGTNTIAILATD